MLGNKSPFDNTFNLVTDDLSKLEIKENSIRDNCHIKDKIDSSTYYKTFILDENSTTKIICEVVFFPSSVTGKYLPRLTFKKVDKNGILKVKKESKDIIISFHSSEQALVFWKLIGFLNSFKDIVDTGEFEILFGVYSKNKFIAEFESQDEQQQVEDLKALIKRTNIQETDLKSILFEKRKLHLKAFLYLLKNIEINDKSSFEHYREKYSILQGDEAVWHHFLKSHDWILGLNVDIKFIREFYDEQKVGIEDSRGSGSPKSDLLGISDYTTLIELKTATTKVFKKNSNKARANTWDFTSDFVEGISQCLGQKFSLEKDYRNKDFANEQGTILDKNQTFTMDPKTVFIIGNRKAEFPHNREQDNITKSQTFERFRRNNRNIDIITFDELFERAYHTAFGEIIQPNWFYDSQFNIEE